MTSSTEKMLAQYRASEVENLFIVGSFAEKVTVLQQQIRSLNLVHHLMEGGVIDRDSTKKVAIIGAGFSGLTVAAGLIAKTQNVHITIFERRDALIPLQQGSDSRWLHPTIYDWPDGKSASNSAMLPLLNWTSGRASDVAVQVLENWAQIIAQDVPRIDLFCNVRYVKCLLDKKEKKVASVEWVGDRRDPSTGMQQAGSATESIGDTKGFDLVIACVGFGLEQRSTSYWRNENLAQPSLGTKRNRYLISGAGDGGIIDLLRARVQNFRQDRVLGDIFNDSASIDALRDLKKQYDSSNHINIFEKLAELEDTPGVGDRLNALIARVRRRLRSDSEAIFNTKFDSVADLFDEFEKRVSFQNAVLLYCLYRSGGFTPVSGNLEDVQQKLVEQYDIPLENVIVRHGTKRDLQIARLLAGVEPSAVAKVIGNLSSQPGDRISWEAGYFGFRGNWAQRTAVKSSDKVAWRKEYLPAATEIATSALCSSICSIFETPPIDLDNYRITFHRALLLFDETVLQQCCRYMGQGVTDADTAGRTFLTESASIGLCYRVQQPLRTRSGVTQERIYEVMDSLSLHEAAREMRQDVRSIACVPLLQPETNFYGSRPVAGILYFDSADENAFVTDNAIRQMSSHLSEFIKYVQSAEKIPRGYKNINFSEKLGVSNARQKIPVDIEDCFEIVDVPIPIFSSPTFINIDQTSYFI